MSYRPIIERSALEYETEEGRSPFGEWLLAVSDGRAKAKITKAITKMESGNFGDHKPITNGRGLQEYRLTYGPGYRIYYITEGKTVIVLFAGSDKSDQSQAISKAKEYLEDYRSRKK